MYVISSAQTSLTDAFVHFSFSSFNHFHVLKQVHIALYSVCWVVIWQFHCRKCMNAYMIFASFFSDHHHHQHANVRCHWIVHILHVQTLFMSCQTEKCNDLVLSIQWTFWWHSPLTKLIFGVRCWFVEHSPQAFAYNRGWNRAIPIWTHHWLDWPIFESQLVYFNHLKYCNWKSDFFPSSSEK